MFKKERGKFLAKAKFTLSQAMASPDLVIVQTVASIDEAARVANLLSERLTEWYGLHFPEFKTNDPKKYAQVAAVYDRQTKDETSLSIALGNPEAARAVAQKASSSLGVALSDEDIGAIRQLAKSVLGLYELREGLESYRDRLAERLCPNLSHLAGPALAARLVAKAGSLSRLSLFPSSTVQVIGAEKALFKHLKSGSPPPKHGLIFQHAIISTAPKKLRGKLARALAGKLAIAARADATTKNFIAPGLKASFDARAAAILSSKKAD